MELAQLLYAASAAPVVDAAGAELPHAHSARVMITASTSEIVFFIHFPFLFSYNFAIAVQRSTLDAF